jgi:hypothetical protein
VITDGLRGYNEAQAGCADFRPLTILARDHETKKVVGGLLGRTSLGLLRVDTFFLPENLRRGPLHSLPRPSAYELRFVRDDLAVLRVARPAGAGHRLNNRSLPQFTSIH